LLWLIFLWQFFSLTAVFFSTPV